MLLIIFLICSNVVVAASMAHICIMNPSPPWKFGPYQSQGIILAEEFVSFGYQVTLTPLESAASSSSTEWNGWKVVSNAWRPVRKISEINAFTEKVGCDVLLTIMDLQSVLRDADFSTKSIAWFPHHYDTLNRADSIILQAFDAVIALSPSSKQIISKQIGNQTRVLHIPHVVDVGPVDVDTTMSRPQDGPLGPHNYLVLIQGGNYDEFDRKGFSAALQAFAKFNEVHQDSHLLVHTVGPTPQSIPLYSILETLGVEDSKFTLVSDILPTEQVYHLKRISDVCLHPSKSEGFGMNVLECQMLGTPVITTNFTAMSDYTFDGISVPPGSTRNFMRRGFVAEPDVKGISDALGALYDQRE